MNTPTILMGVPVWNRIQDPTEFTTTPTLLRGNPSWTDEQSSREFHELPTISKPVEQWSGLFEPPLLFDDMEPEKGLRLTKAESGLFQKISDLNHTEIAEFLTRKSHFLKIGSKLAYYCFPCWQLLSPESARDTVYKLAREKCGNAARYLNSRALDEIIERIRCSPHVPELDQLPLPDHHLLCCRDQMYLWPDGRTVRHSNRYLRFAHLEVNAQDIKDSSTPYFDRFIECATHGDSSLRQLILEVIGVILTGYPTKSFFVFQGVSDSGKSQLARFLKSVLGPTACFAVNSINQLAERWTTGMLPGKLLCLCADVPDKPLNTGAVGTIKQLTGDDPIHGEVKYRSPFVFQNTAKLLFLSNFPLRIAGERQDSALLRRLVRVPFRYPVPVKDQIPRLHEKLFEESGGIIWQALQALECLDARNGSFTAIYDDSDDLVHVKSVEQERVLAFVREKCTLDPESKVSVGDLRSAYLTFRGSGEPIKPSHFGQLLCSCGLPIQPWRTGDVRGYQGIRLASTKKDISSM